MNYGEVFFILRDDDVRKVNKLEEQITPDEYTDDCFDKLMETFKACNNKVKNISSKLNFSVVIIPLTFSYKKIVTRLVNEGINVLNFYLYLFQLDCTHLLISFFQKLRVSSHL